MTELCWICKARTADSFEHMFKASDIKLNYGKISPEKRVYKQINFGVKKEVLSIRDKKLTFYSQICQKCNNTETQLYDDAWSQLSEYFYKNYDVLKLSKSFNPIDVFKNNSDEHMKFVHLYFCKIIGCYLKDVNLDLKPKVKVKYHKLSKSLQKAKINKMIFLNFGFNPNIPKDQVHLLMNNINSVSFKRTHRLIKASTFLSVGRITIGIAYWDNDKYIEGWWNPLVKHQNIKFNDLSEYVPNTDDI